MIPQDQLSDGSSTPPDASSDLLAAASADFRANLKHSRALPLLVEHYLKRGLTAEQVRLAVRNASTRPTQPIHVILPAAA